VSTKASSIIDHPDAGAEQTPVRLGCVSYLNTLPLIEGLGKLRGFRLTLTAPARLVDLLAEGTIELGLVSLVDFQRAAVPGGLAMLPAGMIGCDGATLTVRLFSAVPPGSIRELHADADSHTSVALARIILAERYGVRPSVVEFDVERHHAEREAARGRSAVEPWPETLLLIGDKVVTDSPPASRYPHQIDLGEAWKQLTGLPFVYAVWMCRASDAGDERIVNAARVLDRQRRHNATRLGWIVEQKAGARGWPADLAHRYVDELLQYGVTPAHREAVERFFDLALKHGVISRRRAGVWREIA